MIVTLALFVTAIQGSGIAPSGNLAFACALGDYETIAAGKPFHARKLAALGTFEKGNGTVREVYDPTGLLNGRVLSALKLAGDSTNKASYFFILKSAPGAARPVNLIIKPNGEPKAATAKNDFFGIFGVQGQAKPTHVGKCEILSGGQAEDFFIDLRSSKVTKK